MSASFCVTISNTIEVSATKPQKSEAYRSAAVSGDHVCELSGKTKEVHCSEAEECTEKNVGAAASEAGV